MEQDHANESNKVRWVDISVAFVDEECRDEQSKRHGVHDNAESIVEVPVAWLFSGFFRRRHWVHHDAEGDEEGVLREEQNDEESVDVTTSELVDSQVEDDDRLEAEQALNSAPSLLDPRACVEVETADHEQSHHTGLEHDPTLFDVVAHRVIVVVLIELLLSEVRRPPAFNLRHGCLVRSGCFPILFPSFVHR